MVYKKIKESPKCKYCNSINTQCNGKKYNKQRYICKDCNKSFSDNDNRVKRDNRERELALLLYNRNSSIRSIQSIIQYFFETKISTNVINNWIKTFSKLLQINIDIETTKEQTQKPKKIEILEMDDLYSYFYDLKKNSKKELKYGLLLIGKEIKLLDLK